MKKNYLFLATAAAVMAGCANEDFIGDSNISNGGNGDNAIGFNMSTPAITRALEDKDAAEKLNSVFYVWGEKNESKATITDEVTAANTVFKNYTVKYGENTANTTTSNTKDWEYVGLNDAVSSANLTPQTTVAQTIKYWDANATDYTFTAVSAKPSDITDTNNKVEIKKITKAPANGSALDKGYEITIKDLNAAADVYVSDRVNIAKKDLATNNPENAYGGYVKFTFRNFQSKVRFGIYEKVPGYKVVITKIVGKEADTNNASSSTTKTYDSTTKGFGVTGNFVVADATTKYNVTYEGDKAYESGKTTVNRAKVTVDGGSKTVDYLNTGGQTWLSTTSTEPVGTDATSPTWDKKGTSTGDYTAILPNPGNTTNMTLQISYNLISEDTGEIIEVNDKTVNVPAQYCQWKPNFAYTYLFKITDKSADLYPITFDACVVEDETGKQETITTVSEPSWTTFATRTTTDSNNNSVTNYVTGSNEYLKDDIIYATLSNNGSIVDLSVDGTSTNVKLYTVTTSDATNFKITEGSVANAIKNSKTSPINCTPVTINASGETLPVLTKSVPTEDGNSLTLSSNVLKWKAADATVYAVEYINGDNKTYKIVRINGAETTTTSGGN